MPYKFFDSRKLQRKLFKDIKTDLCFLVFLKRACGKTNFTVFYSISNHFMVILACFKPFFYDQKSPFLSPKKGRFCSFKKSPLISFCRPFGDKLPHLVTLFGISI